MRKIVLLLFIMVLGVSSYAQNSYIELTVTDTMLVKADYFHLRVNIVPDYDNTIDTIGLKTDPDYYKNKLERQRQKQLEQVHKVEILLKENGFLLEPIALGELNYKSSVPFSSVVTTTNTKALQFLLNLSKTGKGITFNLLNVGSKNEEEKYNKLFKKVLDKAKEKATYIASLQNKKLGGIISLIDKRLESTYSYVNAALITGYGVRKENIVAENGIYDMYPISNTIVIKFALK